MVKFIAANNDAIEPVAESTWVAPTVDQVLSPFVWVFFAAFIVAFFMTPIMRRLALANGIVDYPDLRRKKHPEPIAYLGGLAVFAGWVAGAAVCFMMLPHSAGAAVEFPLTIIAGATMIVIVGLLDDVYGLSPRVKLGVQFIAAGLLAWAGIGVLIVPNAIISLGATLGFDPQLHGFVASWLGTFGVMVLVVGACNSTNLLDGLDGLAGGVTAIVALGFTFMAVMLAIGKYSGGAPYSPMNDPVRIVMCLALLGAVLGFLPFNFHPARIFMGDAGSMLLGYLCAVVVLLFGERGDLALVMAALIIFALPIMDAALAIVRRRFQGRPIFSADNQHLHHMLIKSGMSVRQATVVLYLMAGGFAVLGCLLMYMRLRYVAAIFMVVFAFIFVTAYKVGHRQYQRSLDAARNRGPATPAAKGTPTTTKTQPHTPSEPARESEVA